MSCSLCPHVVQEYFERVSDIVTTYRPQILKQVEYEKISENLVLRGAVRPEEHDKLVGLCDDNEGHVSQMLVIIQNRMWGLENLLASFMEEHISAWLTQQMFQAYSEHLVKPLKAQREMKLCQCVRFSNSILYKTWVQALKSLDSWILKTGALIGFMNQSIYPADNVLAFLSDKLADYTGGDSTSSSDLVPYGFAPNSSGEVQVAELEEDDINDLISLSETLCIGYPSSQSGDKIGWETSYDSLPPETGKMPITTVESDIKGRKNTVGSSPMERKRSVCRSESDEGHAEQPPTEPKANNNSVTKQKLMRQQYLIARLSTPKTVKEQPTQSKSSLVRLRSKQSLPLDKQPVKQRPKSMEIHRSFSVPPSTTSSSSFKETSNSLTGTKTKGSPMTGKTTGFVRSKNSIPTSPKSRLRSATPNNKPTAVAKPTMNPNPGEGRRIMKTEKLNNNDSMGATIDERNSEKSNQVKKLDLKSDSTVVVPKFTETLEGETDEIDIDIAFPSTEIQSLFLTHAALDEEQTKSLGYYQLNFDEYEYD